MAGENVDLLALVGADTELKKKAQTKGGEWAGPCPFCGGRDRFVVWPNAPRPGWYCRACNAGGDAIEYVKRRDHLSFAEACKTLELPLPERTKAPAKKSRGEAKAELYRNIQPPAAEWQAWTWKWLSRCREVLKSPAGADAMEYLKNERGLSDDTIDIFKLGYCPQDDTANPRRFYRGIAIPWFAGGEIWAVNIRRDSDDNKQKYRNNLDGRWLGFGLNAWRQRDTLFITEGEFDCMLLHQHIGDVADVLTMGGYGNRIPERFQQLFAMPDHVFIVTDKDDAGERAAEYWTSALGKARVVQAPGAGKDVTDSWREGVDLRGWALSVMGRPDPKSLIENADDLITVELPLDTRMPVVKGRWRRGKNSIIAQYTRWELACCQDIVSGTYLTGDLYMQAALEMAV